MNTVEFPNLFDGTIKMSRVAISLFGFNIYWYGFIITLGVVLASLYALKNAERAGLSKERVIDIVFWGVIGGIIGARAYYVIFYNMSVPPEYRYNLRTAVTGIRDGGLAVYGGIILAVVFTVIACKVTGTKVLPILDLAGISLPIGQAVGRWGNFVNQEAFGAPTAGNLPWGMTGNIIANSSAVIAAQLNSGADLVLVHPCFLYESLWCAVGAVLLGLWFCKKRGFDGQMILMYVMWYGAGRYFIESLRTDSLYIGSLRVSQAVALVSVMAAAVVYSLLSKKKYLWSDTSDCKIELEKEKAMKIMAENIK